MSIVIFSNSKIIPHVIYYLNSSVDYGNQSEVAVFALTEGENGLEMAAVLTAMFFSLSPSDVNFFS